MLKNGEELESRFNDWLNSCKKMYDATAPFAGKHNIVAHVWLSSEKKEAPFDFWIMTAPDINTVIYVDLVGWFETGSGIRLNTRAKEWPKLLKYCKDHTKELQEMGYPFTDFKAYIAYSLSNGLIQDDWEFVKVQERLPTGGLFLSSNRKKGIRSPESVFGVTQDWVADKEHYIMIEGEKVEYITPRIRTREQSNQLKEYIKQMESMTLTQYNAFKKALESCQDGKMVIIGKDGKVSVVSIESQKEELNEAIKNGCLKNAFTVLP